VLPCAVMAMGAATAAEAAGIHVHMYTVCCVVLHCVAVCVSVLQCVVYALVCYCVL